MKTLGALVLSLGTLAAAPTETFDYEASKVQSLKQLEECTYRVQISNVYSINGYKELVKKGQASLATIGEDDKRVYFITNSHVIEHEEPEVLLRDNLAEIRGALGNIGETLPTSKISLEFKQSHAKLMDYKEKDLPDVDLDLLIDDPTRDLALLSVPRSSLGKYVLCPAFGDSDKLERGNVLYAFGYGKGEVLMTRGIYSGTIISPKTKKPIKLMDGSITNGYSGSGVYAIKEGKPFYVGLPTVTVFDNPKYGGFTSSNTIRAWLGVHGKENILISQDKKSIP